VDDDRVGFPRPARREDAHRVEVADGHEVHITSFLSVGEPGRVMPRREAELPRIDGRAERIVVEAEAAHEGERGQPV